MRICADMGRLPLESRSVSLVWSNMALHSSVDAPTTLAEYNRVLEVEGLIMFSTLGPDTLKELRSAFAGFSQAAHVHSFIDMHDIGDMLVAAGFAAPVMDTETITLTYADFAGMTADLKSTGQVCALTGRSRGLSGPRMWKTVAESLGRFARDGRIPATVEVVYGHAWKAAPRKTPEGDAIVNFRSDSRLRN
jgi:malonyl-CoA O-methyltransferase